MTVMKSIAGAVALVIGTILGPSIAFAVQLHSGQITTNQTWLASDVHVINGNLRVMPGATLTLAPNVVVKIMASLSFYIDGGLVADGASGPITITSYTDDVGGDTNGDGSATIGTSSRWQELIVSPGATANLSYCTIRNGGRTSGNARRAMLQIVGASATLDHCTVSTSFGQGLSITGGATPSITNSTITGCESAAVIQSLDADPTIVNVVATGNPGGNGIQINGGQLDANRTWKNSGLPYILSADVRVGPLGSLSIQPGTAIKMTTAVNLFVDGDFDATGTAGAPIYFTSYTDDVVNDTNNDGAATTGDTSRWKELVLSATADAILDYCTFRYGGRASNNASGPTVRIEGSDPTLDHCSIVASWGQGVLVSDFGSPIIRNTSITGCVYRAALHQTLDADPRLENVLATGNPNGNGIQIEPGQLDIARTWRATGLPYILEGVVRVGPSGALTVEPNTAIKLSAGIDFFVDGNLTVQGAPGAPVYFTSLTDDAINDTNNDGSTTSGSSMRWRSLSFSSTSSGTIDHCVIRFGGRAGNGAFVPMVQIAGSFPAFTQCTFASATTTLVQCTASATPTFHTSSFLTSSSILGLENVTASVTIDATLNWWGSASGPNDPSAGPPLFNPGGTGARVSDYVNYGNWQVSAPTPNASVTVSPTTLDVVAAGAAIEARPLQIQNSGTGPLSFTVQEVSTGLGTGPPAIETMDSGALLDQVQNVPWLSVTPSAGSLPPSGSTSLTVSLDPAGLSADLYSAILLVSSNDPVRPSIAVPISFRVGAPLPPSSVVVGDPGIGLTLDVSWTASPTGGVALYRVFRTNVATGAFTKFDLPAAQRTLRDANLEDNVDYVYSVSAVSGAGLEGSRRSAAPRRAHAAVLLVHGVCSDATGMESLATRLRARGLPVYSSLSMTPPGGRPQDLASQLATAIEAIPGPVVNVVAHSMGGLVARAYIALRSSQHLPTRVHQLITVATPHHGSDAARWLFQHPRIRSVIGGSVPCPIAVPAFEEMLPGSAFLNALNYPGLPGDTYLGSSSDPHGWEDLPDTSIKVTAIAGSGALCNGFAFTSRYAWKTALGEFMENDGIVGSYSARLTNPRVKNRMDHEIGLEPLTHAHINNLLTCKPALMQSADLADRIGDLLNGVPIEDLSAIEAPIADSPATPPPPVADLGSPNGILAAFATIERPISVPGTSQLDVYAVGSGTLLLRLRTPAGQVLTANDTLALSWLDYREDSFGGRSFSISSPAPGVWNLILDGSTESQAQNYATVAQIVSSRSARLELPAAAIAQGGTAAIRAWYDDGGFPSPGAALSCSLFTPASVGSAITLFDDGAHGDGGPSDGIYGGVTGPMGTVGIHRVTLSARPVGGSAFDDRTSGGGYQVTTPSDLIIEPNSVNPSAALIAEGDTVQIAAIIRNASGSSAPGVRVQFWDGEPGVAFASQLVDFGPNETRIVHGNWIAAAPDTHVIRVTVDPFSTSPESNYSNNAASRIIVLGTPTVGVAPSAGPIAFALGQPVPNPAIGRVALEFSLARRGSAALEVFDVRGRRIRSWRWPDLEAGTTRIDWDGVLTSGARAPAGVYFVRLSVVGATRTQRLIML